MRVWLRGNSRLNMVYFATMSYELIKQAIETKTAISGVYRGRVRELCPHVLGYKGGRAQALFYQFGGESSSGLGPDGDPGNWRCMFISELSDVSLMDGERWHTASNHSSTQPCVDDIEVEVRY